MDLVHYDLPNGMHVILQPTSSAPVIACNVWVGVGSADETPQEAGLAHVHEHMLFKGTARRGVGQIAREVEAAGGHINAFTSFDQTCYYVVMSSRFMDTGLDILADAIQHSAFDAEELARELEVIQEEIKRGEDSPSRVASLELFARSYVAHPYRLPVIGTRESVNSFTQQHVLDFFHKHYVPSNMTLVLVGDFELELAKQKIEAAFGGFASSAYGRPERAQEPEQRELRAHTMAQESQECYLRVGFHIPDVTHEDIPALDMLGVILGQGEASRLHKTLVRDLELVSGVYTGAYTPRDSGLFMLSADYQLVEDGESSEDGEDGAQAPDQAQEPSRGARTHAQVVEATLARLFDATHEPFMDEEIQRARVILESQAVFSKQTIEGLAMKYGQLHMVTGDVHFEQRYYEQLSRVDAQALADVARRYLRLETCTLVLSHPKDAPAMSAEALEAAARQSALESAQRHEAPRQSESAPASLTGASARVSAAPPEARQAQEAVVLDELGFAVAQLEPGLTLIVQEDHAVEVYAARALTMGGVRLETPQSNGVNSLLATLLTSGTSALSAEQIAMQTESQATSLSGMSGRNTFGISLSGLSRALDEGLELMAHCWFEASLPEEEVERERFLHLQQLKSRQDQLGAVNFDRFAASFFQGHPYAMPSEGTPESIRGLRVEDMRRYLEHTLRGGPLVMAVVGDVDAAHIIDQVRARFGQRAGSSRGGDGHWPALPSTPAPRQAHQLVGDLEKNQAHLIIGYDAPRLADEDRFALDVMHTVLSGQGGRLFMELRDRQSLAYSVYASVLLGVEASSFMISIGTSPEKIEQATYGMIDQVRRLHDGISVQELEDAKRYLIGNHDISLQRSSNRAMSCALDELYGLGYRRAYDYSDRIAQVSAEQVAALAQRTLRLDETILAITKPSSTQVDPQLLARALAQPHGARS